MTYFHIYGKEPGDDAVVYLMRMPTRQDAEAAVKELEAAGDTDLEIREVEE